MMPPINEDTRVGNVTWRKLKDQGMMPHYYALPFYDALSQAEIFVLKCLRAAQKMQEDMYPLGEYNFLSLKTALENEPEFLEVQEEWRSQYEKQFFKSVEKFISKNRRKLTGHYNIVPNDISERVTAGMVCYADFVKPTCKVELMMVSSNPKPDAPIIYQHPFVPQTNLKNLKRKFYKHDGDNFNVEIDVFDKELSVFKPWQADTQLTLEECAAFDFKYWKVPRFVKDVLDIENLQKLVIKNYEMLKHIYTTLMSQVDYPCIGWNKFSKFCKKSEIIDSSFNIGLIDRCFTAANYEIADMGDNPNRAL